MKTCYSCKNFLSLDNFYRYANGNSLGKCKECHKRDVRANRLLKIEYYRQYDRNRADEMQRVLARLNYANSERGKERDKAGSKRWIERNPEKRKAHHAVNNAIRDGRLIKQPCEMCFADKVHAHHDDYSKPFEIRWLCVSCHALIHKDEREQKRLSRIWQLRD